ncbi:hypothetical protein BDA96_06G030800 [Sorghum bicolor]|uniref:Uncharacterized protein n=1 Tax=Sorghum bicolor TaxID=4558 RepID=A0A921QN42_SORBI|nr:hypothetical protein BDA96_06G030800 [Sorghum bicolor]
MCTSSRPPWATQAAALENNRMSKERTCLTRSRTDPVPRLPGPGRRKFVAIYNTECGYI